MSEVFGTTGDFSFQNRRLSHFYTRIRVENVLNSNWHTLFEKCKNEVIYSTNFLPTRNQGAKNKPPLSPLGLELVKVSKWLGLHSFCVRFT